jgi:hypothetical protein
VKLARHELREELKLALLLLVAIGAGFDKIDVIRNGEVLGEVREKQIDALEDAAEHDLLAAKSFVQFRSNVANTQVDFVCSLERHDTK